MAGNYFVGLTKHQVMVTMNIANKRDKKFKKLPYLSENCEDWMVLKEGEDWVLWFGNGLVLQKVPSNEIIRLETKKMFGTMPRMKWGKRILYVSILINVSAKVIALMEHQSWYLIKQQSKI